VPLPIRTSIALQSTCNLPRMTEPVPSRTAGRVARRRAAHQVLDRPLVFDDPLALRIAGIVESDILADIPREQHPLARALRAFLDDLDGDAINARYFSRRDDGLRVGPAGRLLYAEV